MYFDSGGQETLSSPTSHLKEDVCVCVCVVYNMYAQGGLKIFLGRRLHTFYYKGLILKCFHFYEFS